MIMLFNKNMFFIVLALSACNAFGMQNYRFIVQDEADTFCAQHAELFARHTAEQSESNNVLSYLKTLLLTEEREAREQNAMELAHSIYTRECTKATRQEKLEYKIKNAYALYQHATHQEKLGLFEYWSRIMPAQECKKLVHGVIARRDSDVKTV